MPEQTARQTTALIEGASPTIFVSDLARSVRFYTETLGLKLMYQAGDEFAQVDAGKGVILGLHPKTDKAPAPGTKGAISVGFDVTAPIEQVVETLTQRGVKFRGPIVDDDPVRLAFFGDPDDNDLYLCQVKSP